MNREKELVIITGVDSGIGESLVQPFTELGYTVVGTYLEKKPESGIGIKLDIRSDQDILGLEDKVKGLVSNKGYDVRCLINNAGIAVGGPIENLPMNIYRDCFEVNFFGSVRVIQKMIPWLIKSKGTIIINGSAAGRVALPFLSPYVSTKYALEGFSDSLRRELIPYGIKTILIEPGAVATPIWNKAKKQDISFMDNKYAKSVELFREIFIEGGNNGIPAGLAAKKIVKIFNQKNPKARYVIAKNSLEVLIPRLIPAKFLDKILIKKFGMDYGD